MRFKRNAFDNCLEKLKLDRIRRLFFWKRLKVFPHLVRDQNLLEKAL